MTTAAQSAIQRYNELMNQRAADNYIAMSGPRGPKEPGLMGQLVPAVVPSLALGAGTGYLKSEAGKEMLAGLKEKIRSSLGMSVAKGSAKEVLADGAQEAATKAVTKGLPTTAVTASAPTAGTAATTTATTIPAQGLAAIPAYVGPAVGAVGMYDLFKNKRTGVRGVAQGAASGAAMGSYFGAPGAIAGGIIGGGIGLANTLGGSKNRWKEEQDRAQKLADKGIIGWDQLVAATPKLTGGRSKSELIAIEQAKKAAGQYSNEDFARTRDVKYLKPEDIWGYSAFGERFGNDWLGKYNEDQRRKISQAYLNAGALSEGRGQIKLRDNDQVRSQIASILADPGFKVEAASVSPQSKIIRLPTGAGVMVDKKKKE